MDRAEQWARLVEPFDLLIIGGGATGLGSAVEAASRGYKVALLESHDFAKGTSSRSTKLVHGGVRYLAQGNVSLVREALIERGRLRRNAAHLVGDLEFVVPAYAWWSGSYYGVGLKIYDVLAGKQRVGSSRHASREQVLEKMPNLEPNHLKGGILYFDGQFDDARLAISLLRTAADHGATLLNYAKVVGLLKKGDRILGAVVRDMETGREVEVRAKVVINATGVFADAVRRLDEPQAPSSLAPSQGIHLVLPPKYLQSKSALVVPKTDDGRVLFVVPWHGKALLGTTDTPVAEVSEEPRPLDAEIDFLFEHAKRYLVTAPTRSDIVSSFAGLRPLVKLHKEEKNTGGLSRDHTLFVSKSGLLTIIGGKWTTYRKMGEDAVNRAAKLAELAPKPSVTPDLPLHGSPPAGVAISSEGTPDTQLSAYGSDGPKVRELAAREGLLERLHPDLPYLKAEVVWAARFEMARTVEDVLSRRTRALLLDARASRECAPVVAELLAKELRRDASWKQAQLLAFEVLCRNALLS